MEEIFFGQTHKMHILKMTNEINVSHLEALFREHPGEEHGLEAWDALFMLLKSVYGSSPLTSFWISERHSFVT